MYMLQREMGWIEVICGPMFSGKTEELIRRLRRALYAKQGVKVFKPKIDTRYGDVEIVSHSKQRLAAHPVADATAILAHVERNVDVVGIDETQFFDSRVVEVAQELADRGMRVIAAGLDQDFRGEPFGPMPQLLAVAEVVTKASAICMECGNPASRSQRTKPESHKVLLGAEEAYEARCRSCHTMEIAPPVQAVAAR